MLQADPTTLLTSWRRGNRVALDELFPLVYEDLRRRAHRCLRSEAAGHTLTTTALVHEAYLRLVDSEVIRQSTGDAAHDTSAHPSLEARDGEG